MAVIDRLVERVLDDDVPLERGAVERAVRRMLPGEAPLAPPGVAVEVADALVGLGPLEPLLTDPRVSDILVNADGSVWVERAGSLQTAPVRFTEPAAVVAAVQRVIAPLGLRLDRASPAVDARLPDGSRLHAIIPPASVDGPVVAIRRFTAAVEDLDGLVAAGAADAAAVEMLRAAVTGRRNLLVSGGTGSGKTTLLNILTGAIPDGDRVVVIEDSAELQPIGHMVRLEARPPNTEGAGEITLRTLVRHALRLRPDRIIIGEVRGPEALDMIQAINTGHAGSMSTVHANGPDEAMWRLETLAMSAPGGLVAETIRQQLWSALDVVVQLERAGGPRRLVSVSEVVDGTLTSRWSP